MTLILALATAIAISSPANANRDISGLWFDDSGRGAIQLYECSHGMCGRIVWLRQPLSKSGEPLQDVYNPSPQRRNQPICGLLVVAGLQSQSDGTWDEGRIYDPKVGRSYNVAVERIGADRLRVTGYIGAKLFGKSFIWRRAPDGLEKCSASG